MLLASVALIVAATTMPWSMYYVGHGHWPRVEWVPFTQRVRPGDFLLNMLLFVPFGASAFACHAGGAGHSFTSRVPSPGGHAHGFNAGHRLLIVVLAAILLSIAVEVFQVYSHGRLPTTTDVVSNAIGAFVGGRLAAARMSNP